ncbi:hypothetical protein OG871_30065 [Kitasatospora sp. NBC_00374]|uniref:hypothetical protein n=1 Tax=Kitasatospora sp. NBC_00374 TaxID=2975964 RepID=UPI003253BF8D
MTSAVPTWPGEWQHEITSITQANNVLGPTNALFKKVTADPAIAGQVANLVASLLDPAAGPHAAKAILIAMNDALPNVAAVGGLPPGTAANGGFRLPSRFPLPSYTVVLELIAAKALWLNGHTEFLPWPFDEAKLKPDFAVRGHCPNPASHTAVTFYDACTEVGDSLKVGGTKTGAELLTNLYSGITGKLGAYPKKQVTVFMDACDNPSLYNGANLNFHGPTIAGQLQAKIATELNPELKECLVSVFVLFPDWTLARLDSSAWR